MCELACLEADAGSLPHVWSRYWRTRYDSNVCLLASEGNETILAQTDNLSFAYAVILGSDVCTAKSPLGRSGDVVDVIKVHHSDLDRQTPL